ncbi:MAG TPA: hypothetical protein PKI93_06275 [Alphaproteobacteria bacterium]|nr:hypothetical protein [Alphaproteobacteria bacterium]HNS44349.1 hypothetical protein [Alphaproteobacteria bacterium]
MTRLLGLLTLVLCLTTYTPSAQAEEETLEPSSPAPAATQVQEPPIERERPPIQPTHILPSKIKPVQGNSADDDSMSKAAPNIQTETPADANLDTITLQPLPDEISALPLWQDLSAGDLKNIFSQMDTISDSPTVRQISISLLSTLKPQEDDESANGELFGLRLTKLLAWGELQKTIDLYKRNDQASPPANAAKAAIVAMLAKGETGVACLELKALPLGDAGPDDLFSKIDLFCKGLLSPAAGDDESLRFINAARIYNTAAESKTPDSIESLNALDPMTVMSLGSAGLLNTLLKENGQIRQLGNLPLALLLEKGPQSPDLHLHLLAESIRRGFDGMNTKKPDLSSYLATLTDDKNNSKSKEYSDFLNQYINLSIPPSASLLKEAQNLTGNTDILIPLYAGEYPLPLSDWTALPSGESLGILRLLALANQPLPIDLAKQAFPDEKAATETDNEKESTGENILFNHFMAPEKAAQNKKMAEILAVTSYLTGADDKQAFGDGIYDNIFNLTESGNYVMPSDDILSSLKKTANKKPSVQEVIESLKYLDSAPLEKIHPAAMYGILAIFNSAGLSVQTKALGREVLGRVLEN